MDASDVTSLPGFARASTLPRAVRVVGVVDMAVASTSATTSTPLMSTSLFSWAVGVGVTEFVSCATSAVTSTGTATAAVPLVEENGKVGVADVLMWPVSAATSTLPEGPTAVVPPCVADVFFFQTLLATHDAPTRMMSTLASRLVDGTGVVMRRSGGRGRQGSAGEGSLRAPPSPGHVTVWRSCAPMPTLDLVVSLHARTDPAPHAEAPCMETTATCLTQLLAMAMAN